MSILSKNGTLNCQIEMLRDFANSLHSDEDKAHYAAMLRQYTRYCMAIYCEHESFPSEHLVEALIIAQHNKMIDWLKKKI
jgi:hypothetical protein